MAFENLQDQLKEQFSSLWDRIQESPSFNSLRERYETLSPSAQKGLIASVTFLVVLFVLSFPYSFFSNSITQNEEYENNRNMLRGLLKASRLANEAGSVPRFESVESVKSRIEQLLTNKGFQQEQLGGVIDLSDSVMGGSLAPPPIIQKGIGVSLKKLNLTQLMDVANDLQGLHLAVKLSGMEISAQNPEDHYFDVLFKVAVFNQPGAETDSDSRSLRNEGGSDTPDESGKSTSVEDVE